MQIEQSVVEDLANVHLVSPPLKACTASVLTKYRRSECCPVGLQGGGGNISSRQVYLMHKQ